MTPTRGNLRWVVVIAAIVLAAVAVYRIVIFPARGPAPATPPAPTQAEPTSPVGTSTVAQAEPTQASPYPYPPQPSPPSPETPATGQPYPTGRAAPPATAAAYLPSTAIPTAPSPTAAGTGAYAPPTLPTASPTQTETATTEPTATASPPPPTPLPPTPIQPTPTPAYPTHPRPTTLPRGSRGQLSNIGPYLLSNPEAGQPTHNLLQSGHMRAYLAINPAHWGSNDRLPNMEGYGRNWIRAEDELELIRQGTKGGRTYFDRFKETYRATREDIHAWMSTWAFTYRDRVFAEQWVAFQREWLRLMHQEGFRAGVGGMRTHMFKSGEITWLAPAIADSDYLFLSEADAPTLIGGRASTAFRYRNLVAELQGALGPDRVPEVILDVAVDGKVLVDLGIPGADWRRGYLHFGIPKADYAADVRAYDLETLRDPYVRHVFWFATNYNSKENESFDVDTNMLAIAEGWHVAGGG